VQLGAFRRGLLDLLGRLHVVVGRRHFDLLDIDGAGLQFLEFLEAEGDLDVAQREESGDVEDDGDEKSHARPPAQIVGTGQAQRRRFAHLAP